jgi:DNA-binding NarL/FixJ family response regulator
MAPVDGLRAAHELRATLPIIGIVMMSARDDLETIRSTVGGHVDAFVSKAAPPGALVTALAELMLGRAEHAGVIEAHEREGAALATLSQRERAVMLLVSEGYSSVQIGAHLRMSPEPPIRTATT